MSTIGYSAAGVVLIVLELLPKEGIADMPAETATMVNTVLTVTGLFFVASSIPLRKTLDGNAPKGEAGNPALFRNMIVAMALSEGAGAMGFITALMTGSLAIPMILWGAAIGGCILHFPTQRMTEDTTGNTR